jgi:hypothetical protein
MWGKKSNAKPQVGETNNLFGRLMVRERKPSALNLIIDVHYAAECISVHEQQPRQS